MVPRIQETLRVGSLRNSSSKAPGRAHQISAALKPVVTGTARGSSLHAAELLGGPGAGQSKSVCSDPCQDSERSRRLAGRSFRAWRQGSKISILILILAPLAQVRTADRGVSSRRPPKTVVFRRTRGLKAADNTGRRIGIPPRPKEQTQWNLPC